MNNLIYESVCDSEAFWISPKGKIMIVDMYHITSVLKNPKAYGFSNYEIDSIYKKYDEPRGLEGQAREEIMKKLLKNNWIRIRFMKRNYSFTIQLNKLDKKRKDYIQQWAFEMNKGKYSQSDVRILTLKGIKNYSMSDLKNDLLYKETESKNKKYLLESVDNFSIDDSEIRRTNMKKSLIIENGEIKLNNKVKDYRVNDYIFEQSLSRIWQHSKKGFIMMSAAIGKDEKEDEKSHKKLRKRLKSLGLGYFEVDGVYTHQSGERKGETVHELSVFIPFRKDKYTFEEFKNIAKELRKEFKQESVLFYNPESGAELIFVDDSEKIGDNIGYDKIKDVYSKLRKGKHQGKTFVIEGVRIPMNHISAMGMKSKGILF